MVSVTRFMYMKVIYQINTVGLHCNCLNLGSEYHQSKASGLYWERRFSTNNLGPEFQLDTTETQQR